MIKSTPAEREVVFKGILAKEFPTLWKLVERLDECKDGKDLITIDANFATQIEDEIFKLIVQRELQSSKIQHLQSER